MLGRYLRRALSSSLALLLLGCASPATLAPGPDRIYLSGGTGRGKWIAVPRGGEGAGERAEGSVRPVPEAAMLGGGVQLAEIGLSARCGESGILYQCRNGTARSAQLVVLASNEEGGCPLLTTVRFTRDGGPELEDEARAVAGARPGGSGAGIVEVPPGHEAVFFWACVSYDEVESRCKGSVVLHLR